MDIKLSRITPERDGDRCYVHARGLILPSGFGIITTQKLELSGSDVFWGLEMMKSHDGGKIFSPPVPCQNLKRIYREDGTSVAFCDATPFLHKKTGKIILVGHTAWYDETNTVMKPPRPRATAYAVYDEVSGDFSSFKELSIEGDEYFTQGAGCAQIEELPSGELLIPIYYNSLEGARDPWHSSYSALVMRCEFDGDEIRIAEIGKEISVATPRGLYEPSITEFKKRYFLALRNDETGFAARSTDGMNYEAPVELCFDDGEPIGNYNTQQHWLKSEDRLYLVYTRRAATNDHVFRHRAPLFIAEFDPDRMCIIRESEMIAVPERGARLGNFGCQSYSDEVGYIFAAEWMQCGRLGWDECAKHGSDNTVFISKIIY